MLDRIARLTMAAPRRVLVAAAAIMVAAAIFGIPVAKSLSAGGFQDPGSESARAAQLLTEKFHQGDMELLVTVTASDGATGPAATAAANDVIDRLRQSPHVARIQSPWTVPPPAAAALTSKDGKTGLIVAGIVGNENDAQKYANSLVEEVVHDRDGVTLRSGGVSMIYAQITAQSERDLLLMESIAFPLSFLVLVWVFGGLIAAALPMVVGGAAILGSMLVLRLLTLTTDVSIFALNLTTAMGLAMAIDYTLLIISRYRDELAEGRPRDAALKRTMQTAGRTVVFAAVTVALSMSVMLLFPMYFLKSFAYAGIATLAFAAAAALTITPAAIWLLGDRLDSLDVSNLVRKLRGRAEPAAARPVQTLFWYRWSKFVMRRSLPIGLAVVILLLALGAPFLGVRWGFPDDRVLPTSASAHQVGDQLRNDFATDSSTAVSVVIPDAAGIDEEAFENYSAELSRVPDVTSVTGPVGTFAAGQRVAPAAPQGYLADGSAFFSLGSAAPLFSDASQAQLDRLHAITGPSGRAAQVAGYAQVNRDSVDAITERLPVVLGLIAVITFGLLFVLTGSVILPVKAVVLNVLSLTAAFGALVWIFQEGHLGALGTTATGTLVANMPVLLFCIAFGLSMDYEVFLVARVREYRLQLIGAAGRRDGTDRALNDEAVALGLARTGRVITAAALVMSITFAALTAAQVSFMRMFGVGLTLAILVDATLVRMVLVPSFMHVAGGWNWWAPKPLARLHERIGISESGAGESGASEPDGESGLAESREATPADRASASMSDTR